MIKADLSADLVRDRFDYDAGTGLLTRRSTASTGPWRSRPAVGCANPKGHLYTTVEGKKYFLHRLVWLHHYGQWPKGELDHINGDKSDNRIANLRDVVRDVNQQNLRGPTSRNALGVLGVWAHKGRFRAGLCVDGKNKYLGLFKTVEQASAAYLAAKREHHRGCTL